MAFGRTQVREGLATPVGAKAVRLQGAARGKGWSVNCETVGVAIKCCEVEGLLTLSTNRVRF